MLGLPRRLAAWLSLVIVAGAVACVLAWGTTPVSQVDTPSYLDAAQKLSGTGFDELPYRSLGYPAILVLTGSANTPAPALFFAQLAFHAITVWVVIVLAKRLRLPDAGSLALAVVLMSPPVTQRVSFALAETACTLFVVLTALLSTRWLEEQKPADAIGSGVAIALATTMRPNFLLYGFLVVAVVAVRWARSDRRRFGLQAAALFALGPLLIIGGMAFYNLTSFGYPGFSPLPGWYLSTKTSAYIEHLSDDEPAKAVLVAERDRAIADNPHGGGALYALRSMDTLAADLEMDRTELSNLMLRLNLRLVRNNPDKYLASVVQDSGRYVLPADGGQDSDFVQPGFPLWFVAGHLLVGAAFFGQAIGVLGLEIARRLGARVRGAFSQPGVRRTWWVAMSLIAYSMASVVLISFTSPRHRLPTDPLILLLAFAGTWMVIGAFRTSGDVAEPSSG